MPKMRWSDPDAFDDLPEEWDESDFEPYDGDEPPGNIVLRGVIKKVWATQSQNDNDMLKVLFEARDNEGERAEYDGWGVFDNVALTPKSAFRYGPLFEVLGVTLSDVKSKTVVGEDDNTGSPVLKIGTVKIGDGIPCKVRTKIENNEEYGRTTRVGRYMPDSDNKKVKAKAKADDWEDEGDAEPPARRKRASAGSRKGIATSTRSRPKATARRGRQLGIDDDDLPF